MKQILVVEDDRDIQELLQNFLQEAGYGVALAEDGVQALTFVKENTYDLILLDIMLPKIDGYGVLELVRRDSRVPVVMLTALDSEASQLKSYELMVDDYITKPFSMKLLLHKIAAVLRRAEAADTAEATEKLRHRELAVDLVGYRVTEQGEEIELTAKEFQLLRTLLQNRGKVLTRATLLDSLWEYDFYGDERVVDTHIKNLRKKLSGNYIETIRGVGYRIDKET